MTTNKYTIIDTVKLIVYKENSSLLEKVNFDNYVIFLESLLFTYFNAKKDNLFSSQMLIEMMQGYFIQKEPLVLEESFNNMRAYIPISDYN